MYPPPLDPLDLIVANCRQLLEQEAHQKPANVALNEHDRLVVLRSAHVHHTVPPPGHDAPVVLRARLPVQLLHQPQQYILSPLHQVALGLRGVLNVVLGQQHHRVAEALLADELFRLLHRELRKEEAPVPVPLLGAGASEQTLVAVLCLRLHPLEFKILYFLVQPPRPVLLLNERRLDHLSRQRVHQHLRARQDLNASAFRNSSCQAPGLDPIWVLVVFTRDVPNYFDSVHHLVPSDPSVRSAKGPVP
mmetsp:Transcript_28377/g.53686  ORF Transcript_28377/g.53686 Transcript_28377/m.53686 type:complete len:248 (+) Transcript_28377:328-1071(+)